MTRLVRLGALASMFTVVAAAGCGFDCEVQGETEHFNDCDALQARFDGFSEETDAASRNDLLVCGELVNCEVQP
jgi:hypothetical protein